MNLCNIVSAALAGFAIVLLIVVCAADNSVALGETLRIDIFAGGGTFTFEDLPDIGLFETAGEKTKDFQGKIGETFQAAQAFTIMAILIFAAAAVLAFVMPKAGAGAHAVAALFSLIAGCLIIAVVYIDETTGPGITSSLDDFYSLSYGGFFAFFCAILGCAGCCLSLIAARPSSRADGPDVHVVTGITVNEPDAHVGTGVPESRDAEKQV